jgi:TolB-like protein
VPFEIIEKLKRRNVFRVAVAYAVLAWIVIQVTDTVAPPLHLPSWTLAFVTWIGIIGFPFALFFAWAFELTPEGVKRSSEVARTESIARLTGRKIDFIIIGLLAAAVVVLIVDNYVLKDRQGVEPVAGDRAPDAAVTRQGHASIAVLPFVNMSNDPEQDYLSDGLAEELLNLLARIKGLKVAARTSSFAFRDEEQDIRSIGNALNVSTLLEGSVRKSGDRIRVTAQLIDAADGYHLWSDTFDRELTDIFRIQDEISAAIVTALRAHLDPDASTAASSPTSVAAYDLYLQGRHLARELKEGNTRKALDLFRQATDIDPDFAPAWAARAAAVLDLRETQYWGEIPAAEAFALAQSNIDKALALDPLLAEAHVSRSMLYWHRYRFEEALASADEAVAINPNLARGHLARADNLKTLGRIQEAEQALATAADLDPLDQTILGSMLSIGWEYGDESYLKALQQRLKHQAGGPGSADHGELLERVELSLYAMTEPGPAKVYQRYKESGRDPSRLAYLALKEVDDEELATSRNPALVRMDIALDMDQLARAQELYDSMPPEMQNVPVVLEDLSILQMRRGECAAGLATLDRAHGGRVPIYGQVPPFHVRSNSNLALNRVHCLKRLGRDDEAAPIMEGLRRYVGTLRSNAKSGYESIDAKLRLLEGDKNGVLDALEKRLEAQELSWRVFADPVLRSLSDEPRFVAMRERLDAFIDAERAKLGWPPAAF